MKTAKGVTIVELMVAMTIMMLAVALAAALLVAGASIRRNTEIQSDESDQAQLASNDIVGSLQMAANGASKGVWVVPIGSTTPTRIGAVFGTDGADGGDPGGTDDLWLIVPDKGYFKEPCLDRGAAGMISAADGGTESVRVGGGSTGALKVNCTASLRKGDMAMVTNLNSAALISDIDLVAPTSSEPGRVSFAEQTISTFSNTPEHGGVFHQGDVIYKAQVLHYFVGRSADGGSPSLYRSVGALTGTQPSGLYPFPNTYPFVDSATVTLVQSGVEDFQVAYGIDSTGTGQPTAWQHGMAPGSSDVAGSGMTFATLRALRVSVVIRNPRVLTTATGTQGGGIVDGGTYLGPLNVENHLVGTPTPDGRRRYLYSGTIPVPNLNPGGI